MNKLTELDPPAYKIGSVVMVIADRFECLAIAMAAGYMNIPIVHLEGGEISGSIDEMVSFPRESINSSYVLGSWF